MEIKAGEFKAKCLQLMDDVAEKGGEVIITKRGKAIARLVPMEEFKKSSRSFMGWMKGSVKIKGDIIHALESEWEANG